MKKYVVLTLALTFVAGYAWGDVAIANSMGEPDSNRAGEDLPESITSDDGVPSVDTTDTAGDESTASLKLTGASGGGVFSLAPGHNHFQYPDFELLHIRNMRRSKRRFHTNISAFRPKTVL